METKKQYCKPQAEDIDLILDSLMQQASVGVKSEVIDEDATESAWSRRKYRSAFDDEEEDDDYE